MSTTLFQIYVHFREVMSVALFFFSESSCLRLCSQVSCESSRVYSFVPNLLAGVKHIQSLLRSINCCLLGLTIGVIRNLALKTKSENNN